MKSIYNDRWMKGSESYIMKGEDMIRKAIEAENRSFDSMTYEKIQNKKIISIEFNGLAGLAA